MIILVLTRGGVLRDKYQNACKKCYLSCKELYKCEGYFCEHRTNLMLRCPSSRKPPLLFPVESYFFFLGTQELVVNAGFSHSAWYCGWHCDSL